MNSSCSNDIYEKYEIKQKKKQFNDRLNYLTNKSCCSKKSCMELVDDLTQTKFLCDDIYSKNEINKMNITEKGALRSDETVCSRLHTYQNNINNHLSSNDFVNIRPFFLGGNKKQSKKNINMKKTKYNKKNTYKKYTRKRKIKIKRKNKKYTRNIKH
jgi:hypothetical protein